MKKKKKDKKIPQGKINSGNKDSTTKNKSELTVVGHLGYNQVSTNLPNSFFEGLLIREMELNNDFTMDKLLELVNQYSLAIEFYMIMDPMKAKAYQIRMEYLLTNKDTLVQLSRLKSGKIDENEKNQKIKMGTEFNKTKQYVKLKQEDLRYEDISQQVNTVLNKGNKNDDEKKNVKSLINDDIKKQDESWKEKFMKKKNNFKNKNGLGGQFNIKKKMTYDKRLDSNKRDSSKINIKDKDKENNEVKNEIIINKEEEIKEVNKEENKVEKKEENKIKEDNKIEDKKEDNEKKEKEENNKKEEIKIEEKEEGKKNIESIINQLMKEQEEEEEDDIKKEENNKKEEEDKKEKENPKQEENKEDLIFNKIIENSEPKDLPPFMSRTSIVDEDLIKKMEPDEEISKSITEQIQSLKDIIKNLNKPKSQKDNENDNDNEEDEDDESNKNSEHSNSNSNLNKISEKNEGENGLIDKNFDKIPAKFRSTYYQVESLMIDYMNNFNEFFYQDIFEQFSSGLKELYELKYKKYIEIRNEYHNQIKENEYLLENDENLTEEKKLEIQQTIDSLNEEQQHQIDTIEDEFNRKIMDKISEFRLNSFKSNSGIQLLEERIKLDIYSLINDSFY